MLFTLENNKLSTSFDMVSALEALLAEEKKLGITTNCKRFDQLFGEGDHGGIPLGALTEICGMAGLGKTQTCMQLCSSVQIPTMNGRSIYIDCEGSFVSSRMLEIAQATSQKYLGSLTAHSILESISLIRPESQSSFTEYIVNDLEETVKQSHGATKLIVIDSIAFYFRSFTGDYAERTRTLSLLAQKLRRIAQIYQVAIVVTNQMTTKVKTSGGGGSLMVPAMGESWGHCCTHRIILLWHNKKRCAWLCKSSTRQDGLAAYEIAESGLRDVSSDE